jgi:hypothetical protein
MGGNVLPWVARPSSVRGWTNDELAELYRVENSLVQAGLVVATERGLTDEGEPWFVFCNADGNVVVHVARINGVYLLDCASLTAPLTGLSFEAIAKAFVAAVAKTQIAWPTGRVVAHPSALLSLLVAAAMVAVDGALHHSAHAAELFVAPPDHPPTPALSPAKAIAGHDFAVIFASSVWRNTEGAEERNSLWQAVEDAAVGMSALSPAFALSLAAGATDTELTYGARSDNVDAAEAANAAPLGFEAGGARGSQLSVDENSASEPALVASALKIFHPTVSTLALSVVDGLALSVDGVIETAALPVSDRNEFNLLSPRLALAPPGASSSSLEAAAGAHLDISIPVGGEIVDLSGHSPGSVSVFVASGGALTLIHAEAVASIEVHSGVKANLTLTYEAAPSSSSASTDQTVKLDGADDVTLAPVSIAQPLEVVLASEGTQSNTLHLADPPVGSSTDLANFHLKVTGSQDLALTEPVDYAATSELDASSLTGKLSVSINFGGADATIMDLSLGAGNLNVSPQDTIAIQNLSGSPQIQLGLDLQTVLFGYSPDAIAKGPVQLAITLGATDPVKIGDIEADGVNDLTVTSSGGDNVLGVIGDSALQKLTLMGSTSLEIDSILAVNASDSQAIAIDASQLSGNLTLDASAISDSSAGGRLVSIATGSGVSHVTDTNSTDQLNVAIGSGQAFVNLGAGTETVTISGLKAMDQVNVGSGAVFDVFTNGISALAPHQTAIDSSASLSGAASMAAQWAENSAPHQALLFSYKGSSYVFIDAAGSHLFDPVADAIVQVIGVGPSTDLSGIFHSS